MPIIAPISRDERRLMQKAIHKTHDKKLCPQTDCHADAAGATVSATLPERSAAPVPLLDVGLTGSRSRVLRD